jgi:hypothetical protein
VSSKTPGWKIDRRTLRDAIARWHALDPGPVETALVDDFLMDLVEDPFAAGHEDDSTGVWTGWAGFALAVYVPDRATRTVSIADINYA